MIPHIVHPDEFLVFRIRENEERLLVNHVQMPFWRTGVFRERKHIRIFIYEVAEHIFFAIDFSGAAGDVVQRPYIVQAASVVLVIVSEQYCIQMTQVRAKHLHPEIRPGIHENLQSAIFNECGCSETLVSWVF